MCADALSIDETGAAYFHSGAGGYAGHLLESLVVVERRGIMAA